MSASTKAQTGNNKALNVRVASKSWYLLDGIPVQIGLVLVPVIDYDRYGSIEQAETVLVSSFPLKPASEGLRTDEVFEDVLFPWNATQ
jgi:hypothetical protein